MSERLERSEGGWRLHGVDGVIAEALDVWPAESVLLVGHSIGGMIVQQLLANNPRIAGAVVLAQTSPAFGKPDGDWQKAAAAYDRAIAKAPNQVSAEAYGKRAAVFIILKDYKGGLEFISRAKAKT